MWMQRCHEVSNLSHWIITTVETTNVPTEIDSNLPTLWQTISPTGVGGNRATQFIDYSWKDRENSQHAFFIPNASYVMNQEST